MDNRVDIDILLWVYIPNLQETNILIWPMWMGYGELGIRGEGRQLGQAFPCLKQEYEKLYKYVLKKFIIEKLWNLTKKIQVSNINNQYIVCLLILLLLVKEICVAWLGWSKKRAHHIYFEWLPGFGEFWLEKIHSVLLPGLSEVKLDILCCSLGRVKPESIHPGFGKVRIEDNTLLG